MPDFSYSDINEAKRRVKEMQDRAKSYTESNNTTHPEQTENKNSEKKGEQHSAFGLFDLLGDLSSGDDSSKGLILALIMILSKEKADNMLIFALLYILL
ncbi:MAG: hypothetical protein E7570_01195 [Ruminococcaceae bacterium]|nr:hypothetical protein [Oscillospiraceae bacterium]